MWAHSLLLASFCLYSCMSEVSCEECSDEMDGDIRLMNGESALEGRVEICREVNGGRFVWGTVCDDRWDSRNTAVVCRQLGFSPSGSNKANPGEFRPEGLTLEIFLDEVNCDGHESRLVNCPFSTDHDCNHREDVGVYCQPNPLLISSTSTGTSVLISWHDPGNAPLPSAFNVIIESIDSQGMSFSNQPITNIRITIGPLPNTATEVQYDYLIPLETYRLCIVAVYGSQSFSNCDSFTTSQPVSENCSQDVVGGVLGFVIVVLLLLLIAALAYPRCIRSRVKDKKYLSSASQFLDRTLYVGTNAAYIQNRPQVPPTGMPQGRAESGSSSHAPTYETIHDPPIGGHMTAHDSNVAQHYEMSQGHLQGNPDVSPAGRHHANTAMETAAPYSQLQHK